MADSTTSTYKSSSTAGENPDSVSAASESAAVTVSPAATSASATIAVSSATAACEQLDERIQNLPQELQDRIKEVLVNSSLPDHLINITWAYKPPLGLQIDRKTRQRFASNFYRAGVVHHVEKSVGPDGFSHFGRGLMDKAYRLMRLWLRSLDEHHCRLVEDVEFNISGIQQAAVCQGKGDTLRREVTIAVRALQSEGYGAYFLGTGQYSHI